MAIAKKAAKKTMVKPKPPAKKIIKKASTAPKKASTGSRRLLSDQKIVKLQKLYKSNKYSAQHLCDEFGISMATLFNYLKVQV